MTLLMRDQENQEIGEERGRREGIREGMLYTLVSQVRKKLLRGYSKEQIADLLEEDIQTVENICRMISAHPEEDNRDGAIKIFLNAKSNLNDVSSELRAFLDYLGGKKSEDEYVQKLEKAVREAKRNRKWRHEYMTLLMRDQENQEIGEERGRREGKQEEAERYSQLILKLVEEHKESMITEIAENSELREKLYRQYDL